MPSNAANSSTERRRQRNGRPTAGSDVEVEGYSSEGSVDSDEDSSEDQSRSQSGSDDDNRDSEDGSDDDSGDGEEMDEQDEFEIEESGAHVAVYSVSREPKSGYNSIESEHVGDIIRTLSYWIWRAQK